MLQRFFVGCCRNYVPLLLDVESSLPICCILAHNGQDCLPSRRVPAELLNNTRFAVRAQPMCSSLRSLQLLTNLTLALPVAERQDLALRLRALPTMAMARIQSCSKWLELVAGRSCPGALPPLRSLQLLTPSSLAGLLSNSVSR